VNIAELSIRKSVITWVMTVLLIVVGVNAFYQLSWLEDPEFTIKDAVVTTQYPGASAAEVEGEVTNVIEKAIQQLGQLKYVESRSSRGLSVIKVKIKDEYDKYRLPQVWDELRRKVNDAQGQLPPGAGPTMVNDDFGDVFGIYVAITGEGYSYREIYEYAKFLQRELLRGEDVKKIALYGVQPEVVYIEMRRDKMSELGVSQQDIYNALAAKNLPASAGNVNLGPMYLPPRRRQYRAWLPRTTHDYLPLRRPTSYRARYIHRPGWERHHHGRVIEEGNCRARVPGTFGYEG
jgi:multidrug efflux pump subunit AcrB